MNNLLAKYLAVVEDVDADKELTAEQKLGFYKTLYRSLIHDVESNEFCHLILGLFTFMFGLVLGAILR